ncbi:MAG TPA: DUF3524 domain-containing protein [Flavobacteriales bacterium]|nr:DUF3524 domain-containing protein [Flavobacteriales bacterium]HIA12731.1 DUF3524 domain-containing protein [Flavobacteriales bacterium]
MKLLIVEPYFTGSHKRWAEEYAKHSGHEVELLTLSGHYWKWRMHGGAISLAAKYNDLDHDFDLILVTDMLDLSTFQALTRTKTHNIPFAVYFHENQLTYPWSETDRDVTAGRDNHYGFINYASALCADRVLFNSQFHYDSFLEALPNFLKGFPDNNELNTIEAIKNKSEVLYLGIDLRKFDSIKSEKSTSEIPIILWNHRWEYDKNPDLFFEALYNLDERGLKFNLVLLGENFSQEPDCFEKAKKHFGASVLHYGFSESFEEYASWLHRADILPVTSNQDFFGGSAVEAMYCGCTPLLPNDLAFPEHVPEGFQGQFLYKTEEELVTKLEALITNHTGPKEEYKEWVSRYDWQVMAPIYDTALSSFLLPK